MFCFHSILFSGTLSCEFQRPSSRWSPSPQLRESSELSWALHSCTSGQKPSHNWYWGNQGAFLSLRSCSFLPDVQGLENHYFIHLMCLLLFQRRRGNLVPVTPSFPEAGEIMFELGPSPPQCMLHPHHPSSLRQKQTASGPADVSPANLSRCVSTSGPSWPPEFEFGLLLLCHRSSLWPPWAAP